MVKFDGFFKGNKKYYLLATLILIAIFVVSFLLISKGFEENEQELLSFQDDIEKDMKEVNNQVFDLKEETESNLEKIEGVIEEAGKTEEEVKELSSFLDSLAEASEKNYRYSLSRINKLDNFAEDQAKINEFYKSALGKILEEMEGVEGESSRSGKDSINNPVKDSVPQETDSIRRIDVPDEKKTSEVEKKESEGKKASNDWAKRDWVVKRLIKVE